mgnify:CR=1 FL=1
MVSALQDALRDGASLAVSSAVILKLSEERCTGLAAASRTMSNVRAVRLLLTTRLSSAQKPRKPSRIIGLLPDPLRRRHSNAVRPPPGTSTFVRRPSVDVPRRAQGQQLADVDADVVVLQPATPEETARTPVISRPLPPTPPPMTWRR